MRFITHHTICNTLQSAQDKRRRVLEGVGDNYTDEKAESLKRTIGGIESEFDIGANESDCRSPMRSAIVIISVCVILTLTGVLLADREDYGL